MSSKQSLAAWPAEQLLPLGHPTADIAYGAIMVRRSNQIEFRLAEDPKLLLCPDCMSSQLAKVRGYGIVSEDLTDCLINYLSSPELMARSLRPLEPDGHQQPVRT